MDQTLYQKCATCLGSGRTRMFPPEPAERHSIFRDTHKCTGCDGLGFVPVSSVRSWREALVEAAQGVLDNAYSTLDDLRDEDWIVRGTAMTRLRVALAALRATPEPERAE